MTTLDAEKRLISELWLDQPDAHERIERRIEAGTLVETDAAALHSFVDDGYLVMHPGFDDSLCAAVDRDIDRLWEERPADLAVGRRSSRTSFHDFGGRRIAGYRIPDLHSHSPAALALYLDPEIFRMVELIFGAPAIATQSLYFEHGSQQALHRDPMFVVTKPPGALLAAWIALEDITADAGPLLYAPGSHRMPWFEFEPDQVSMGPAKEQKRARWREHLEQVLAETDMEVKSLTCRAGDVFIWHAGLLHGGAAIERDGSTRKSLVVHYTTAASNPTRRARMRVKHYENGTLGWRTVAGTNQAVLERDGRRGLDNPQRGYTRD